MGLNAGTGLRIAVLTGTGSRDSLAAAADHVLDDITAIETLLPDLQPA
jgi:phosphoglycolate phosphatase